MRWFWIDRFEEFVRNKRAVTRKNVTLAEEPLNDYCLGYPHYPASLIIEGMAQTGGLLVGEPGGFDNRVVLAKVSKAVFHDVARPGDQIRLTATLQQSMDSGAVVEGLVTVDDRTIAELELWFAFLDERFGSGSLFPPDEFLRVLRVLHLYDVGVDENGNKIFPPERFVQAERDSY